MDIQTFSEMLANTTKGSALLEALKSLQKLPVKEKGLLKKSPLAGWEGWTE